MSGFPRPGRISLLQWRDSCRTGYVRHDDVPQSLIPGTVAVRGEDTLSAERGAVLLPQLLMPDLCAISTRSGA